jgi:hypothetical protein
MAQQRHPAIEELVAYYGGELDAAAAEKLADHLTACPDCAALVLDLDAFPAAVERNDGADEVATRKAWKSLETQLEQRPLRRSASSRTFWQAAAAVLALLAVGLTAGLIRLAGDNAKLERQAALAGSRGPGPEVNVPIVDLFPAAFVRGEQEAVSERVAAGAESVMLILNLENPDASPRYDLEVFRRADDGDEVDRQVWSRSDLEPTPFGNLTLVLPADSFPSGTYRFVLSGPGSSGDEVASYTLRLDRL